MIIDRQRVKRGDIIKIIFPITRFERDYLIAIWGDEFIETFTHNEYSIIFGVDMRGAAMFRCGIPGDAVISTITMHDYTDLSNVLLKNKLRYNKKTNTLITYNKQYGKENTTDYRPTE